MQTWYSPSQCIVRLPKTNFAYYHFIVVNHLLFLAVVPNFNILRPNCKIGGGDPTGYTQPQIWAIWLNIPSSHLQWSQYAEFQVSTTNFQNQWWWPYWVLGLRIFFMGSHIPSLYLHWSVYPEFQLYSTISYIWCILFEHNWPKWPPPVPQWTDFAHLRTRFLTLSILCVCKISSRSD